MQECKRSFGVLCNCKNNGEVGDSENAEGKIQWLPENAVCPIFNYITRALLDMRQRKNDGKRHSDKQPNNREQIFSVRVRLPECFPSGKGNGYWFLFNQHVE